MSGLVEAITASKCFKVAAFMTLGLVFLAVRFQGTWHPTQWIENKSTTTLTSGAACFSKTRYNETLFKELKNASNHQIWFLETSYKRNLTAREACSIESACRYNDGHTVHLLTTGNITEADCSYYRILSTLQKFRSAQLTVIDELVETPLAALYASGVLHKSPHRVAHLSDFLRYALLWKHGGVYLDKDVIVMKPLAGIRNSIVYQSHKQQGEIANGILFFSAGHPLLEAIMDTCFCVYNSLERTTCGPTLMSELFLHTNFSERVNFLDKSTFLQVPYYERDDLFSPSQSSRVLQAITSSYGVHFWNKMSNDEPVLLGSGCVADTLAKAHCPKVYKLAVAKHYF